MQGVGPGTLLGGRYTLRHRMSASSHLERWSGQDATLEREVSLTIVDSEHPGRAGVLDAARRAAGVEDARLVRILDVGSQGDNSFIVEEAMNGSESLATILLRGPLSAEEARRVTGETARALETAGQRGLHHLRLTPRHVLIAADGAIRISGVAVAAAVDGPDQQEPDTVIALRRDAISLAAILYATLTARWPLDVKVQDIEPAPRMGSGVVRPSEISTGVPGDLDALCHKMLNESIGPLTPGVFANRIAPWSRDRVQHELDPTIALRPPVPVGDAPVSAAPVSAAPVSAVGSEPTIAAATHAGSTADQVSSPQETAPQPRVPAPVTLPPSEKGARTDQNTERMRLPAGLLNQFEDDRPPLPLLPASTALPPSRGQSKIVIVIVAAFVGLSLFVGYRGLAGIGSSSSSASKPVPRRTVIVTAPPVTVPASPAPQATATAAAGPVAILSATGFDPQGDNEENNAAAARVFDENLETSWTSEGYNTPELGNLKKGAGIVLDLGQPTSVRQVTIDLGSGPADLTVYAATSRSLTDATVLGSATDASGQIKLKAPSAMPESQYVIVWFTRVPPDGSQFRAQIREIALS